MTAPVDRFDACLAVVLDKEGGYTNDPNDPGGATNMGITLATLREWRRVPVLPIDVQNLTRAEAAAIYRARYWQPLRCELMPPGVDLMVFDFGVNAGPMASARMLQRAVGAMDDGRIGPITIDAVKAADSARLVDKLAAARVAFYRGLSGWPRYGHGWENRTAQVADLARAAGQGQRATA